MKNNLLLAVAVIIAGIAGYMLQQYQLTQETNNQVEQTIQIRPEFAMADLNGQIRDIKEWDGKIILLNFWATWCPPCLHEIPDFIALQEQYGDQGFQVIGIAVDNEEAVRKFADEMKINYPVIAAEFEAIKLSSLYGNHMNGLPYTVIINRKSEISDRITGELSKIKAEALLKKLGIKS